MQKAATVVEDNKQEKDENCENSESEGPNFSDDDDENEEDAHLSRKKACEMCK